MERTRSIVLEWSPSDGDRLPAVGCAATHEGGFVDLENARGDCVPIVPGLSAGAVSQPGGETFIGEHSVERGGKLGGVARWHQQAVDLMVHKGRDTPGPGGDYRHACARGLQ
jgi:hypothetical protein